MSKKKFGSTADLFYGSDKITTKKKHVCLNEGGMCVACL